MYIKLYPAYGRYYANAREALAAWSVGRDFYIADPLSKHNARYCSIRDRATMLEDGYVGVKIYYNTARTTYTEVAL